MRKLGVLVLALSGSLLAGGLLPNSSAWAFFDDTNYRGPLFWPVPYAYGYTYARTRCGHYYGGLPSTHLCGMRGGVRHHHRHTHHKTKAGM